MKNSRNDTARYTVGDLCQMTGITRKTLFYYDHIGLLEPSERKGSQKQKVYGNAEYERLCRIIAYKEAGLLLSEIREIFRLPENRNDILKQAEKRLMQEICERREQYEKLQALIISET